MVWGGSAVAVAAIVQGDTDELSLATRTLKCFPCLLGAEFPSLRAGGPRTRFDAVSPRGPACEAMTLHHSLRGGERFATVLWSTSQRPAYLSTIHSTFANSVKILVSPAVFSLLS